MTDQRGIDKSRRQVQNVTASVAEAEAGTQAVLKAQTMLVYDLDAARVADSQHTIEQAQRDAAELRDRYARL